MRRATLGLACVLQCQGTQSGVLTFCGELEHSIGTSCLPFEGWFEEFRVAKRDTGRRWQGDEPRAHAEMKQGRQ